MGGDGDIRGFTIDGVAVGVEGVVPHFEYNPYGCPVAGEGQPGEKIR